MKQPRVSMFDKTRLIMTQMVPLIRSMEAEFGKEQVRKVLSRKIEQGIEAASTAPCHQADFGRAQKSVDIFAEGEALDYEVLSKTDASLDFNVTRCRYKQLMEELDAVDLGPYLICDHDFAPALRAGMKLTRTQTCMQGATHCDFRYTLRRP